MKRKVHLAHPDHYQRSWWGTYALCKRIWVGLITTAAADVTCKDCLARIDANPRLVMA